MKILRMSGDLLPCFETIELGEFSWECMGHTPVYPGRGDGPPWPMNPHRHQSISAQQPGDVEVTWWTEPPEEEPR